MNDERRKELESSLADAEKAWHAALRMKRDATKAADAAFEKYQAAQLSLNTLLRIMIEQAEDSGAAAKG